MADGAGFARRYWLSPLTITNWTILDSIYARARLGFEQSRTDFCRLLVMRISILTSTWFSDWVSSLSIFVFGYGFQLLLVLVGRSPRW
jgi:hypothetical protein